MGFAISMLLLLALTVSALSLVNICSPRLSASNGDLFVDGSTLVDNLYLLDGDGSRRNTGIPPNTA
jgi:hypothetical protein